MRQGQQNRRGRGRNNNQNRKSQNPLTRSFESTGPDVKVRGTPAHVAEKYMSLARDALSSGDRVLAENYLQHAEHYNRIILTYREQQISQGNDFNGNAPRPQSFGGQDSLDDDAQDDDAINQGDELARGVQGNGEQPHAAQQRFDNRQQRHNRGDRFNRHDRHDRHDRIDRQERGDRHDRDERSSQANEGGGGNGGQRRRDNYSDRQQPSMADAEDGQPAFLRRPVRRPRRDEDGDVSGAQETITDEQD